MNITDHSDHEFALTFDNYYLDPFKYFLPAELPKALFSYHP